MEVLRIGNYLPNEFLADTNKKKGTSYGNFIVTATFSRSLKFMKKKSKIFSNP